MGQTFEVLIEQHEAGYVVVVNDVQLPLFYETRSEARRAGRDAVEALKRGAEAGERTVLLFYYIPDDAPVANPAGRLWPLGAHVDGSVWMIRESSVPWDLVEEIRSSHARAVCEVVRFDLGEAEKIREIAERMISERATDLHRRLLKNYDAAQERFDAAVKAVEEQIGLEPDAAESQLKKAERNRRSNIRQALKKAGDALNASLEAAQLFDVSEDVKDIIRANDLRVKAQADAFALTLKVKSREVA